MAKNSRTKKTEVIIEEVLDAENEFESELEFFKELSETMSNIGEYTLSDILSRVDVDGFASTLKELKEYNADWEPAMSEEEMSKRKFIAITKDFLMEVRDIQSIEKKREYVEEEGKEGVIRYKLFLNEDPNNFGALKNKSIFYDSELLRDKAYGKIIKQLQILGIVLK